MHRKTTAISLAISRPHWAVGICVEDSTLKTAVDLKRIHFFAHGVASEVAMRSLGIGQEAADNPKAKKGPAKKDMGVPDFRVGGHIFATLASQDGGFGNLRSAVVANLGSESPDVFLSIK
jgi:hypothetical protein